ncbi:flagellar hook-associated protein 2 [Microaerobacter geothermalis]|uniref:flagellar hook-associated protein 2 n=1 Tax=Microaerobacter geothermalis TaxID=674972 RepID=UPI001F194D44|nr:flagellar hook-associated protein 2 [Microaerobacter geothermalis]MCF6093424.1 flagellar hook-associated protein 2 [Microaerobacter geothermalis]
MINDLRFSGLASGIDTESIVQKLMNAERIPLDKMEQKKQTLEWQRDAYREMNTSLLELRNMAFDMKLQSTYLSKSASSSNETIVKATASSSAVDGVHTVEVQKIARGVSATSTAALGSNLDANGNIDTSSLSNQFGITGTVAFTLNGVAFSYDTSTKTIYDVVNDINNYKDANGNGLGVKVSYDKNLDRFFLNSTGTGSSAQINLQDTTGTLFGTTLKIDFTADSDGDPSKLTLTGQDAQIVYNGASFTMSTNQFTINGINFDLQSEAPGTTVNLNVSSNTEQVFDKIVEFIGKYNEVIDKINTKLSEEKYRDYPPLTEKQKEEMSEKQIELWEEKAKSGLLRSDTILSNALAQFRNDFANSVTGLPSDMDSMFDIGFKTGSYDQKGKIIIDEDKLRQALTDNPEKVMNLFTQTHDTDQSQRGIAARLYESIKDAMDKITDKAGSSNSYSTVDQSVLGKALDRLENDMNEFEDRLIEIENRYWRQFTAMERAISQYNSQAGWLMQQFGGGAQS